MKTGAALGGRSLKLADIVISDDAIGENLITLGGADAAVFETESNSLYLKAGLSLNAFTQDAYSVTLTASDASVDGPASPVEGSFTLSVYRPVESRGSVSLTAGVGGVLSADAVPVTYDGSPVTGQFRFWQIVEAEQNGDENALYGRHTSGHLHRLPANESWALYGMERIGNANSILLPSRPIPVQSPSPLRVPLELSGSVGLFHDGLGVLYASDLAAVASRPLVTITRGGLPVTQSPLPGYQVLAAAVVQKTIQLPLIGELPIDVKQLLLRTPQGIETWDFNDAWQFLKVSETHAAGSSGILQAEQDFEIDLNKDGLFQPST